MALSDPGFFQVPSRKRLRLLCPALAPLALLVLTGSRFWVWLDYLLQGLWSEKYISDYMPLAMKHAVAMSPWARRSGSFGLLSLGIVYSMIQENIKGGRSFQGLEVPLTAR